MTVCIITPTGGTFRLTNAFILGDSIIGIDANGRQIIVPDSQIREARSL